MNFCYPTGLGGIDFNSVQVTNGTLINTYIFQGQYYLTINVDLSSPVTCMIMFDDLFQNTLSFSSNLDQISPINFNNLTWNVETDCGNHEGEIQFNTPGDISVWWNSTDGFFNPATNTIEGLSAGSIGVFIADLICATNIYIDPIIIPDGELSYTIDQVTPISICTSQTVNVSGMMEGTVQLSATGGSGFYQYSFDNAGGAQVLPLGVYTGIDVAGTYEFDAIDLVSGCALLDAPYTIPENEIDLDIVVTELQPMIDNGAIVLQTATLEAETTFSDNGLYSVDYEWSPIGFSDDGDGIYSEIDLEGTYTVDVDINGGVCQASTTFEVVSTLCILEADVNLDGVVNTLDMLAIAGAYGTFCNNTEPCPADINNDGVVNIADLMIFIQMNGWSWSDVCGND